MRDYSIFYMNELDIEPTEEAWKGLEWDLFISAYNKSDRVITVFNKSVAEDKFWLIQPDYNISAQDFPEGGEVFEHSSHDEVEFIDGFLHKLPTELGELRICIDSKRQSKGLIVRNSIFQALNIEAVRQ